MTDFITFDNRNASKQQKKKIHGKLTTTIAQRDPSNQWILDNDELIHVR